MEEFPSNSSASRQKPPTGKTGKEEVQKVTQGEVIRRKKPLGSRIKETIFGGEARGVGSYVLLDVLVPAAKDMFADAVSMGVEKLVFGEGRSVTRRGYRGGSAPHHTPYNRFGSTSSTLRPDPRQPVMSRRGRATHDFDEILLATRPEAEEVIDRLFDLLNRYEQATVRDLYDLVGINASFTDEKYGWTDLQNATVERTREGYLLNLPKPEPLR
jgi:hypothetical protein